MSVYCVTKQIVSLRDRTQKLKIDLQKKSKLKCRRTLFEVCILHIWFLTNGEELFLKLQCLSTEIPQIFTLEWVFLL